MDFQFDCECGTAISGFTRGQQEKADFQVRCDDCGAVYTVTITRLREGDKNQQTQPTSHPE